MRADNYEIKDKSLDDIKRALNPRFTPAMIARADVNTTLSHDRLGVPFLPGFVGMNNLKRTSYLNVVVQVLAHIPPIRSFFLDHANVRGSTSPVVHAFSEVVRKMWSPHSFKNCVSGEGGGEQPPPTR